MNMALMNKTETSSTMAAEGGTDMVKKQDQQQDVSSSTMTAEGGTDTVKKRDPQDEELRLRERLKRRKENRHRSQSQEKNRRGDGPRPNGLPARDSYGRGPPPGRNWRGGPPGPPRDWRGPQPPRGWRGPPPHGRRGDPWPRHHGRSLSRSRSRGRSRSRSRSSSRSSRSYSSDEDSRSRSRSVDSRSRSDSMSSASSASAPDHQEDPEAYALTKDQRTVFVSQLVMRTDERDIRRYFRRKIGVKVNDVAMLRDKRTGRHKGFCYVELARLEDVIKAVSMNNQAPDFQRFPILIKASEAEKNYIVPSAGNASLIGQRSGGTVGPNGKLQEAQKAYVGNLDPSVTQEHIYSLFSTFGTLDKVMLQTDPSTGISKGFCFLSYRDAKDANLAIQTMSGQTLAGRPLKTGWANSSTASVNVEVVTSYEFPDDAPTRIQNAHLVLAQLAGTGLTSVTPLVAPKDIANAAEAAINAALGLPATPTAAASAAPQVSTVSSTEPSTQVAAPQEAAAAVVALAAVITTPDAKVIGRADNPSKAILIHNMFDKDTEVEPNWEEEIRLDFEDECAKYGIDKVVVMSKDPGGKIYASFETVDGAQKCASSLAGRWFDKRQLRVEFVDEDAVPGN